MFLGSAFLAACGGSKSGSNGGSTGAGATAPAAASSGGSLPPVIVRGESVPVAEQVTLSDLRRYVPLFGGQWLGAWHDSTGASGTSDVSARVNPLKRSVGITVSATGALLITPVQAESYTLNLAGFSKDAASWQAQSPQVGDIALTGSGGTNFTATITNVPQKSIHSIDVQAIRAGGRVDLQYTLNLASGAPIHGAMAWAKGTTRATPGPIGAGSAETPISIQSGDFAAGLLTASDLRNAVGTAFPAPTANGGKLFYDNGIDVSNGTVKSSNHKFVVQYSVYVGRTAAAARAFWSKQGAAQYPSVSGPWKHGFFQTSVPTMFAFAGRYVVELQVISLTGSAPADNRSAAIAATKALVGHLPAS